MGAGDRMRSGWRRTSSATVIASDAARRTWWVMADISVTSHRGACTSVFAGRPGGHADRSRSQAVGAHTPRRRPRWTAEQIARLVMVPLAVSFVLLLLFRPDGDDPDTRGVGASDTTAPEVSEPSGQTGPSEPEVPDLPPADLGAPPAALRAILGDGRLVLAGSAPDQGVVAAFVRRLEPVFGPGSVTVQVTQDDRVTGETLEIDLARSLPSPPDDASVESLLQTSTTVLEGLPEVTLVLTGHTDDVGTADTNLALSVAQAQVVANLLADRGVPRDRIEVAGAGETQPVAPNDTPEGRQANQRVDSSFVGVRHG